MYCFSIAQFHCLTQGFYKIFCTITHPFFISCTKWSIFKTFFPNECYLFLQESSFSLNIFPENIARDNWALLSMVFSLIIWQLLIDSKKRELDLFSKFLLVWFKNNYKRYMFLITKNVTSIKLRDSDSDKSHNFAILLKISWKLSLLTVSDKRWRVSAFRRTNLEYCSLSISAFLFTK